MRGSILELFLSFLHIGFFSIGGGYATIPLIQEEVVKLNQWLSMQEFTDIIAISQMTLGPLAVNTSTFVGIQLAGIPGAFVATFGCVISGFFISLILYKLIRREHQIGMVIHMLKGLRAASVGLIASAGATILLLTVWGDTHWEEIGNSFEIFPAIIIVVSFLILRKKKPNPIVLMVCAGIVGAFA